MILRTTLSRHLLGLGLAALMGAPPVAAQDTAAQDPKTLIAPYLRSLAEHVVGEVTGRAYTDPPRPTAPYVPLAGVSVLLFPYSVALESEIDGIKEHWRDSLNTYMTAVGDVTAARKAYEESLVWAGGGELVRGEVSDANGVLRLAGVPAGEWLLLAWRDDPHPSRATKLRPQETRGFTDIPVNAGYSIVTFWWRRLQVRAGETASVEFNDRNTWLTGIRENILIMRAPVRAPSSQNRRR